MKSDNPGGDLLGYALLTRGGGKKEVVKVEKIREHVEKLISDYSLRKSMSQNGKKLVDGKGKIRIVDFMERID